MEQLSADEQLRALADSDLVALRLAAQVLAHKAELADRRVVAGYFVSLEQSTLAELALRATAIRVVVEAPPVQLDPQAEDDDRRLMAEYLGMLAANERLSPQLRDLCRALRARESR